MKHPFLLLLLLRCLLWLPLTTWAQTTPATTRLPLTGSVAPEGLSKLTLTRGDSAILQVGLLNTSGTAVLDVTGIEDLTLEIYPSSESATQATTPLTLLSADLDGSLTLEEWTAGSGQHATFELGTLQTNLAMTTRQLTLWGVIYGTLTDGSRRTFGAGNIVMRNSNAGGVPPAEVLDPLYPTLSQLLAYTQQIEALEARIAALEAGNPPDPPSVTADSTDGYTADSTDAFTADQT